MNEGGRLSGRRALITGAGSGIGAAVAARFSSEGAIVIAADINHEAAVATAESLGDGAISEWVDVRQEDSVAALFSAAGQVDILVNVAGIGSTTSVVETSLEAWDDVMAVNARGTFLCCKHALRSMVQRGNGSIVNVASVAGLVGLRERAAYCASKGAVVALTRALAIDHAHAGVRVNCICPGTIDTPWIRRLIEQGESIDVLAARQLVGRLGTAEEVASAALFLAEDTSGFTTGSVLVIDGGLTAA
jgi:NAD(P)-dependent dehydrogenase (short-subunit alcohol dehydrogenase family)